MPSFSSLNYFLELYKKNFSIQIISATFNQLTADDSYDSEDLINLYMDAISLIEQRIWSNDIDESIIKKYQQLFHELETIVSENEHDTRHRFIVTIPVADRPQHLKSCLQSLLNLCQYFNYGGFTDKKFNKISVLIADDSKQAESIQANKEMAELFTRQGLEVEYFGAQEQQKIISQYQHDKNGLKNIIGNIDPDEFFHKGASITRNISYLKLKQLGKQDESVLFYFIDSDQEFQVKIYSDDGDKNVYAVNYFYYLDRIFSATDSQILTGKVVGDPPVSPSVMAGNFIEDVICFVSRMSGLKAEQDCQFHQQPHNKVDDAAYHDMADLFGFKPSAESYQYNCVLKGEHDHVKCFSDFSARLNQFFDGEHPTRKSYFEHEDVLANIQSARTIYTGNYIFKPKALKYFIPFANLKLRMAGPVLGRIIKAGIADQFISANLPMLHKRTVSEIGQSEFRPGIDRQHDNVDLSGEFIRQFFGDVMLFSMEKLTELGYPAQALATDAISEIIKTTIDDMHSKYSIKHEEIVKKIATLKALLNHQQSWWNQQPGMQAARQNFDDFISNIEHNFGADASGYAFINSADNISHYQQLILAAITGYTDDMKNWQAVLNTNITQ